MTTEPILVSTDVTKVYRTGEVAVEALKQLTLTVEPGELVAVMGPSGSGKTTLLNCLSGLDDIDAGRVVVQGRDLFAMKDAERTEHRARTMGFIFQAFNLIPVFSAAENVELPLLLVGIPPAAARARSVAMLERVGLGHRVDHRPAELSGGEQQRVTVARAAAGPAPPLGAGRRGGQVGAGLRDRGPGGRGWRRRPVADVPGPAGHPAGGHRRARAVEHGLGPDGDAVRCRDAHARRLDDLDGGLARAAVRATAGLVGRRGEHDAVVAGLREDVARPFAAAGAAVAEVPAEAADHAARGARARAVEAHGGAGAGRLRGTGHRDRPLVDPDQHAVGVPVRREARIVLDREAHGVGAASLVGLGRVDDVGARAVAEVPVVAQQPALGVARAAAVEDYHVA